MGGRPHKGDRRLLQTRPHQEVAETVERRQRMLRISSLSQYIADVLAIHVGSAHLAVELGHNEELPLDEPALRSTAAAATAERPLLQTRPYVEVWEKVHRLRRENGVSSVSRYVADVLALHIERPDLVVEIGRNNKLPLGEELPLAM